jgi:serine/threonine-protein kinase
MIALLVLLGSSFIALRIIFVDDEDKDVVVPDLLEANALEASNRLQSVGLLARIDQVDSSQPSGVVVSQAPAAGEKIQRGKSVIVRASRGGNQTMIPDVRGKEFTEAVRELDTAGFKISAVIRVSDQLKPSGTVMAQNPASPATVVTTRMVDLLVSKGGSNRGEMAQVPDLKGQSEALARQIIEQSDLSVGQVALVETDQVPVGTVLHTQPRAGARVQSGGAVKLFIAKPVDGSAVSNAATPGEQSNAVLRPREIAARPENSGAVIDTGSSRPMAPEIPVWTPGAPTNPQAPSASGTPNASSSSNTNAQNASGRAPAGGQTPAVQPAPLGKVAKIRYQVPPLARPLSLRITISDQSGTRVLREQQTNGGEYFSMDAPYSGSATVAVQLGGERVWQERYN